MANRTRSVKGLSDNQNRILSESENPNQASNIKYAFGGGLRLESYPEFIPMEGDRIVQNANNARIVLTRDRPSHRLTGYGGRGDTQAGAIDIVVGGGIARTDQMDILDSGDVSKPLGFKNGEKLFTDPNFDTDAARIHISQKTDIDNNFRLVDGTVGHSKTRSAIGLKADEVRIVAREGIKLVTRPDIFNSQGGRISSLRGIDLIAGNDDSDLQPMVKGDNLAAALKILSKHVSQLNGVVGRFLMAQLQYNITLAGHSHHSAFFGIPVTVSPTGMPQGMFNMMENMGIMKDVVMNKTNIATYEHNYLTQYGKKYICSRYNNVN